MELDWLQTFVTAAEEGNFRRTADRLHLAQPTVTQHIQKLEASCGATLFDRVGRSVILSAAGRRFLPRARLTLAAYTEGLEDLARWQQNYEETLTVVCSPLIATTFLPRWVYGFQTNHEHIHFDIQIADSREIVAHLLENQADLAFSRLPAIHPYIESTLLYDDPVVMVAPRDRTDPDEAPLFAEEWLTNQTLFTHCHPVYWDDLTLRLRRFVPNLRTMKVSQVHVALHWIAEGMGVSFLPKSTIRRDVLRGTVEEVPFGLFSLPTAESYLLRRENVSETGRAFIRFVEDYMKIRPL